MTPSVGYSGVLFTYVVIQTKLTRRETQSFFGCFEVPSWIYPWILLIALSLLMSNVSFVGHMCGIVLGIAYLRGWLGPLMAKGSWVLEIEQHPRLAWLVESRIYQVAAIPPTLVLAHTCTRAAFISMSNMLFRLHEWPRIVRSSRLPPPQTANT